MFAFSPQKRQKNLRTRRVSTKNEGVNPVKIGKNTFFQAVFSNNNAKCEIAQALQDEFCRNLPQGNMLVAQHADDELSEEDDEDRSIDRLLCPAACRADMKLVFKAVEQLLHTVLFTVVLQGLVK